MVSITDSNIRSTVYTTIYSAINTDKSTYITGVTPVIDGGYPDNTSTVFPRIHIPNAKSEKSKPSLDNTVQNKTITVSIFILSKRNDEVDKMCDGVDATISAILLDGMYFISSSEDDLFLTPNDQKIKGKVLTYVFGRR